MKLIIDKCNEFEFKIECPYCRKSIIRSQIKTVLIVFIKKPEWKNYKNINFDCPYCEKEIHVKFKKGKI